MDEEESRSGAGPMELPPGLGDRILLAVVAFPIVVISALLLFGLLANPWTSTLSRRALHLVLTETVVLVLTVSALGLGWAAFTPKWVARVLRRKAVLLMLLLFPLLLGAIAWGAFVLVRY